MLYGNNYNELGRGLVLLAPPGRTRIPFANVAEDSLVHQRLLADAQRLRGRTYVQDGALDASSLTADGRHIQRADYQSWHLLTVDRDDRVQTSLRYRAHATCVEYSDLGVCHSMQRQPRSFADRVRRAVQSELATANRLGFSCVELGAWVVSEKLRCSTEAVRMLLAMYSLSQILGGAVALSTATTRHNSSSILRRIGGARLMDGDTEVAPYFDPEYDCEMELLSFDSRFPNPRFAGWLREFRQVLTKIPVIWSSGTDMTAGPLMAPCAPMLQSPSVARFAANAG